MGGIRAGTQKEWVIQEVEERQKEILGRSSGKGAIEDPRKGDQIRDKVGKTMGEGTEERNLRGPTARAVNTTDTEIGGQLWGGEGGELGFVLWSSHFSGLEEPYRSIAQNERAPHC